MAPNTVLRSLMGLAALLAPAVAQTFTDCNPTLRNDCKIDPALGTNHTFNWTSTAAHWSEWNNTAGNINWKEKGAEFTINVQGDSPTMQSMFYLFFGRVSTIMKAAPGQGVVSSIVLQSDDLDEVDWELLGGNNTHVLTNYFGKGNTNDSASRAIWYPVDDPQNKFHNYTSVWTKDELQWWLDGKMIRTLKYAEAAGGSQYPQTPLNVRYGIWAAGDPKNQKGVIEWGGGLTDYSKAPFTQTIQETYVEDFSTGVSYKYSDQTGSWQSIQVQAGESDFKKNFLKPHSASERWNALSQGTRLGIIIGSLVGAGILFFLIVFYCIRQARLGKKEKELADMEWEKERASMNAYRMQMMQGGFSQSSHPPLPSELPKAWQH